MCQRSEVVNLRLEIINFCSAPGSREPDILASAIFSWPPWAPKLRCDMNHEDEKKPDVPGDARLLNVGETIDDGDLHWRPAVKHWVAVTPQGEEKVEPAQHGFYCRKRVD